jgi:hypothetical protein
MNTAYGGVNALKRTDALRDGFLGLIDASAGTMDPAVHRRARQKL